MAAHLCLSAGSVCATRKIKVQSSKFTGGQLYVITRFQWNRVKTGRSRCLQMRTLFIIVRIAQYEVTLFQTSLAPNESAIT
jgi:hypothetical protein